MKAEKISRRKQQAAATREKLYLSAERLCQAHNFSDLSVDAIVEAAGVSKGTFYVHFESKDALLAALLADYVNRVDLDYQAYAASLPPHTPAAEKLLALIAKIADTLEHAIGRDKMAEFMA